MFIFLVSGTIIDHLIIFRRESVHSPQCWGFESPSLLNREVSNILSRGNPPAEDERHKWTHPSPVQQNLQNLQAQQAHHPPHTSSRPLSCPLYHTTQPVIIDIIDIHT